MHVDRKGLTCLLDFVDLFALPSAPTPTCYRGRLDSVARPLQRRRARVPMMHAAEVSQFRVPGFDRNQRHRAAVAAFGAAPALTRPRRVLDAAEKIILAWREWTDEVGWRHRAHSRWRGAQHRDARHPRRVDSAAMPEARSTRPAGFAATSRPTSIRWVCSTRMPSTTILKENIG